MEVHTCECLMGCVCRYSWPGSRKTHCYQLWSRTGTGIRTWLLQHVAMTTGFLQNPASPSFPHGLHQKEWKWEDSRGLSVTKLTMQFSCITLFHTGCVLSLTYYDVGPSAQPLIHISMYCFTLFMTSRNELMDGHFYTHVTCESWKKCREETKSGGDTLGSGNGAVGETGREDSGKPCWISSFRGERRDSRAQRDAPDQ